MAQNVVGSLPSIKKGGQIDANDADLKVESVFIYIPKVLIDFRFVKICECHQRKGCKKGEN